jgi:hypothetical protein
MQKGKKFLKNVYIMTTRTAGNNGTVSKNWTMNWIKTLKIKL